MKKTMIALVLLLLLGTACSAHGAEQEQAPAGGDAASRQDIAPEPSPEAADPSQDAPEGWQRVRMETGLLGEKGEHTGETVDFSLLLPQDWTVDGPLLFGSDDIQVGQVAPCLPVPADNSFWQEPPQGEDWGDTDAFWAGEYPARLFMTEAPLLSQEKTVTTVYLHWYLVQTPQRLYNLYFYTAAADSPVQRAQFQEILASITDE